MQRRDKEYVHGQLAVEVAKIQGIFPDIDTIWKVDLQEEDKVETAKEDVDTTIDKWRDSHLSLIVIRAWNLMQEGRIGKQGLCLSHKCAYL